ncbi:MAG: protein-L-isoaspartate(D-aspartate) O-methyltransferase [Lautropia sp.]|nr:protein-L-isoaspartate(D-aspartate) O-methyltransferase [Lautropia sp.]
MVAVIKRSDTDGLVSERARLRMVEQLAELGIDSPIVLNAMKKVPRHLFVEQGLASRAYEDVALPIGHGQTISKPSTVARMLWLLAESVRPEKVKTLRALEIGTGCGYQAAVMARLFEDVVSIERVHWLHELAKVNVRPFALPNLRLLFGDGTAGVTAGAPYDVVISAAASDSISREWLKQMAVGGRLVAPIKSAERDTQTLHVVDRVSQNEWLLTELDPVRFVPLRAGVAR